MVRIVAIVVFAIEQSTLSAKYNIRTCDGNNTHKELQWPVNNEVEP